ncbi:hypothetical protein AOLI_G00229220 [Acnodon oligacanthus]
MVKQCDRFSGSTLLLGEGRQHIEGVSTAEKEAIKTLVHLHLAGWQELQAVFQDAEKHWKQEPPSHRTSSLQFQLSGLEPFFPLLFLLRGLLEHATFPFLSPLQGGSERPFSPLPSPLREGFLSPPLTVAEATFPRTLPRTSLRPRQRRLPWPGLHPRTSRQAYLHPKKSEQSCLCRRLAQASLMCRPPRLAAGR